VEGHEEEEAEVQELHGVAQGPDGLQGGGLVDSTLGADLTFEGVGESGCKTFDGEEDGLDNVLGEGQNHQKDLNMVS